uniref:Uncharacterized protein n=1 Tax=Glycine max TaxID=3847 RepID=A0A0R0KQ84_SOYBN
MISSYLYANISQKHLHLVFKTHNSQMCTSTFPLSSFFNSHPLKETKTMFLVRFLVRTLAKYNLQTPCKVFFSIVLCRKALLPK